LKLLKSCKKLQISGNKADTLENDYTAR